MSVHLLSAAVDGSSLPGESTSFGYQRRFIKVLRPYLARGAVAYRISWNGHLYRRLIGSASVKGSTKYSTKKLSAMIDYKRLYADNPKFDISQLDRQKVKPSRLHFSISTALRNHYADHAHQMICTRNNVAPTIDELLQKMYDDPLYSCIPWFGTSGTVAWTPQRFLVLYLDFDKMRKGYDFVEPKKLSKIYDF